MSFNALSSGARWGEIVVDPNGTNEILRKKQAQYVAKHWLTGGHLPMGKSTKGRVTMYQLPSGQVLFTGRDWDKQAHDRYEHFL